jgi:hypothetical protein
MGTKYKLYVSQISKNELLEWLRYKTFLIPWTGAAFAPLGPFLCPTTEEKMAYCPKARALGPVLSK